ncbi:unnamed protein product [Rotaria socialis]|nr:unnamed protein product [Rotaria socialis]CAF4501792.1 unnamed protein product [Rotaria socialis]CAF4588217.1 unnamed protein product [Rotaria socialis]CAF4784662.1 unnamed protein product [Rotaria socialis]
MDKNIWPTQICSFDFSIDFPSKVPSSYSIVVIGIPVQGNQTEFESDTKKYYPTVIKVERIYIKGGVPISKARKSKQNVFTTTACTTNELKCITPIHPRNSFENGHENIDSNVMCNISKKLDLLMVKIKYLSIEQTKMNSTIHNANELINACHREINLMKEFILNKICPFVCELSDALLDLLREWCETPTLDLLLENWTNHRDKTCQVMNLKQNISLLLLKVSSLNWYVIDVFNLIDVTASPIIILNSAYHDVDTIKTFSSHFFNYNVYSMKGSNQFGGVLIAVHKSIRSKLSSTIDNVLNLIVLEVASDSDMFQLATCHSSPGEPIPLDIFDTSLQQNPNSISTDDLNAKHNSWSRSMESQKEQTLFNWLSTSQTTTPLEIINKFISTSTRSNGTIDLIIAHAHMSSASFSVFPTMGNDHHPVLWHPSFKISSKPSTSSHQAYSINEQGIIPAGQSGFRRGYNMAVRLVVIIDQIGQSLTKKKYSNRCAFR